MSDFFRSIGKSTGPENDDQIENAKVRSTGRSPRCGRISPESSERYFPTRSNITRRTRPSVISNPLTCPRRRTN
jgi:hypothetical protein